MDQRARRRHRRSLRSAELSVSEAYQFDWSHEVVLLSGVTVTVVEAVLANEDRQASVCFAGRVSCPKPLASSEVRPFRALVLKTPGLAALRYHLRLRSRRFGIPHRP